MALENLKSVFNRLQSITKTNVIESKQKMALHEEKVDYLEAVVKSLTTRGYLIKNAIDWKRFTEGH